MRNHHNRRSTTIRAVTAGLALTMLAGQGLAAGHDGEDHDDGPKPVSAEQAWRTDAEIVAKSKDWTVEQALERAELQDTLGAIAELAATKHPEVFTSGIMPGEPGAPAVLRFVDEVPGQVAEAVEKARIDVEFDTSARFTDAELTERAAKIRDVLAEQGHRDVMTAISPAGTVQVQVAGAQREPRLPRGLQEGTELTVVKSHDAVADHDRGGALVDNSNTGGWCTSGWSVEHVDTGALGVTTAGHCTGIDTFWEPIFGFGYDLEHERQHIGEHGDVEWKSSPTHVTRAEFWAHDTQLRDVTSVESWWGFLFGGTYCVYGRTTDDRECLDLSHRDVSVNFTSGLTESLHGLEREVSLGGDSGGGVSFNNEAAGSHVGRATFDGARRNLFSQARLYDDAIDVEVLTK